MTQNKKNFAQKIFQDFIQYFNNLDCSVNHLVHKVEVLSIHYVFTIDLLTDIETRPTVALTFQICVANNKTKERNVYLMRPNNISHLQPDPNRLLVNPYKGMDLLDIEIYEQQKNIDYLKKYINDPFNYSDYNYYCENQTDRKSLGEFNSINDLLKQIF